jgi:hypothetical protein
MILNQHPDITFEKYKGTKVWEKVGAKTIGRQFIGYWVRPSDRPSDREDLPDPHMYVDLDWDPAERAAVVAHLRTSREWETWRGDSWCRFGCGQTDMGYRCLTDGTYVWPEGFAHYVETHGVRPPPEFVTHVLRR